MTRFETKLFATTLLALAPTFGCAAFNELSTVGKTGVAGAGMAVFSGVAASALGADTEEALLIGGATGLLAAGVTYFYYDSRDASHEEQRYAARKAETAKLRLQEEELRELKDKNAVLAVRVDDLASRPADPAAPAPAPGTMEVVYVDPTTGQPIDDEVHTVEAMENGSNGTIDDQAFVFLG